MTGFNRRGVTLLELLVTLCIIAIATAVVTVAISRGTQSAPIDSPEVEVQAARAAAVQSGRPVTVVVTRAGGARQVTALPDGRVVEDARDRGPVDGNGGGRASR